jgi:hypothetical protein
MIMIYQNRAQAKRMTGLSYLGGIATSSKIAKGLKYDEMTYILYLAPADRSGYEVCPMRSAECTAACNNESGHNRIDIHDNTINKARITKTKLFFEQRRFFMQWLQDEISAASKKAQAAGNKFSVRLNGTSDLSPEQFQLDGKNILELFPEIQFYDYTKVPKRIQLTKKYSNYDITFSYSGANAVQCQDALLQGTRVAVVFEEVPDTFWGRPVIDGDQYDMRYIDPSPVIIGLKYKQVRNKLDKSTTSFVITKENYHGQLQTATTITG